MSRPRKADSDLKTSSLKVRMTDYEKLRLRSQAAAAGQSLSDWARDVLLKRAARKK